MRVVNAFLAAAIALSVANASPVPHPPVAVGAAGSLAGGVTVALPTGVVDDVTEALDGLLAAVNSLLKGLAQSAPLPISLKARDIDVAAGIAAKVGPLKAQIQAQLNINGLPDAVTSALSNLLASLDSLDGNVDKRQLGAVTNTINKLTEGLPLGLSGILIAVTDLINSLLGCLGGVGPSGVVPSGVIGGVLPSGGVGGIVGGVGGIVGGILPPGVLPRDGVAGLPLPLPGLGGLNSILKAVIDLLNEILGAATSVGDILGDVTGGLGGVTGGLDGVSGTLGGLTAGLIPKRDGSVDDIVNTLNVLLGVVVSLSAAVAPAA